MLTVQNRGFEKAPCVRGQRIRGLCVGIVTLTGALLVGAPAAQAQSAAGISQLHDGFDASPTDWSFENFGGHAFISVSASSNARSPSQMGTITFLGGGSTSDWGSIGKLFFWNQSQQGGDAPAFNSCGAAMYVKTPSTGAKGQLEVINPFNNTYIAVKTFNLPASPNWVPLSAPNPRPDLIQCTPWLSVRIVLDSTTHTQILWADDATVQWGWVH